jgi:hypothetical protein
VQFNEAYLSHTPTNNDGGDYDSDYYNNNITIQYNYGHDADGYCVSVFGASGQDTNVNTTIRPASLAFAIESLVGPPRFRR